MSSLSSSTRRWTCRDGSDGVGGVPVCVGGGVDVVVIVPLSLSIVTK